MHPVTFVKNHPVGFLVSMGVGMVLGPWFLGTLNSVTGISLSLPSVGSRG